jgi:hypothetical protein
MARIDVLDISACKAQTFTFPPTLSTTINVTIANRGNVATLRPAIIIPYDSINASGASYSTLSGGVANGINLVNCNNLHPTISFSNHTYPGVQQALKNAESATVDVTYGNTDVIVFTSPTAELSITNPNTIESPKTVTRIAGSYNVITDNLKAHAIRIANNAVTDEFTIVNIANIAPTLSLSSLPKLRSGGSHGSLVQNYTATLNSDQLLLNPPTLDPSAGAGTLTGAWAGASVTFVNTLQISDTDNKGTFPWLNFSATGLSGLVTNTLSGTTTYTIEGFVSRRVIFSSISFWEEIGTYVTDVNNLIAYDKDGFLMTYQNSFTNNRRTYTITDPANILNATGNKLHWTDRLDATNNTAGTAFIDIEEV